MVIIKHTTHEADHSKRRGFVIIKQTRFEADHSKGNFGKGKADEA